MTDETLIKLVCGIHIAICVSAFAVLVKFSSFSSGFRSWQNDIEGILKNVKRTLAINLGEKLKSILENAGTSPMNIIVTDETYCEKAVSPTEGENYRNVLFDFINDKAHDMARYRSLWLARKSHSFWAIYLSWTISILIAVEMVIVALIGYYGVLNGKSISDLRISVSFIISCIGIVICFWGLILLLINHNKGINIRGCND